MLTPPSTPNWPKNDQTCQMWLLVALVWDLFIWFKRFSSGPDHLISDLNKWRTMTNKKQLKLAPVWDLHQIASDLEDSLAVARADSQMAIASVGSRHQWRMNILLHYTCKCQRSRTDTDKYKWLNNYVAHVFFCFFLLQKSRFWLSMAGLFYCPVTMMIPFLQGPIPVGSSHYNPCSEETTLVEVLQSSTDSQIQTRRGWDKQTQT